MRLKRHEICLELFVIFFVLLFIFFAYQSVGQAQARSAFDECKFFKESGVPGTCTVQCEKCDCAYIVDNLEIHSCKDCNSGACSPVQCHQEDCKTKCPENSECEQP